MVNKVTAGRFQISNATLSTVNGEVDIKKLISDITVDESIYNYYTQWSIIVVDGVNIFEDYNLSGNETLNITMSVLDGDSEPKKTVAKKLKVIGYDSYVRKSNAAGYAIMCTEAPAVQSLSKRISRSMSGTAVDIIKQLGSEVGLDIKLVGRNSKGNYAVVFPNTTYNDSLEMMIRKSYLEDNSTYHLYTTMWGDTYLRTYKDMIENGEYYTLYYKYQNKGEVGLDEYYAEELKSIKALATKLKLSNPEQAVSGGTSSKLHEFDLSTKQYGIQTFNIYENQAELPKLYNKSFTDEVYEMKDQEAFTTIRASNQMAYSDLGQVCNINEYTPEFLLKKNATLQNSFGMMHEITIAGDSRISAGDTVDIELPKGGDPEGNPSEDEQMSGKYLVTKVHHVFGDTYKYIMNLTVQRDSRKK